MTLNIHRCPSGVQRRSLKQGPGILNLSAEMSSSLGKLLAEEGFKGGKSQIIMTAFFGSRSAGRPRYPSRERRKRVSTSASRTRLDRTRPDVLPTRESESPRSQSSSSWRHGDDRVGRQGNLDGKSKSEDGDKLDRKGSYDMPYYGTVNVDSLGNINGSDEIVEVDEEEDERVKDIYSDKAYSTGRSESSYKGTAEKLRYKDSKGKDKKVDTTRIGSDNNGNNMKQPGTSNYSSDTSSQNANRFDDDKRPAREDEKNGRKTMMQPDKSQKSSGQLKLKRADIAQPVPKLALDEVAVQAMVSILNGYVKRFLKDEELRAMLHRHCFSSIDYTATEDSNSIESKVITNLEQAIEIVEKAAEEEASGKELKKASLQLSVITGLSSNDLKDGCTSEIPNSMLSACAHLYLSVIYKLQKKDRVSAKHLLQVFCNSPFLARTLLLPELWDYLFFPHLSHLKVWWKEEADSLPKTPNRMRKLKLLDKVYNEVMDSGTYHFAAYYKDWLTEGVEPPSVPSIHIPSKSIHRVQTEGEQDHFSAPGSPSGPLLSHSMVSKKLYDSVFSRSSKPGAYEPDNYGEADYCIGAASSGSSAAEVKRTLTCSSNMVNYLDQDIANHSSNIAQENGADHGLTPASKEEWQFIADVNLQDETDDSNVWQETIADFDIQNTSSDTKANELALKTLAKSVFELQQTEEYGDLATASPSNAAEQIKSMASCKELHGSCEFSDEESPFLSVPEDFVCPLSGQIMEDPVTLETGQTFELEAIGEWFNQGNKTCPVTGKTLKYPTVPLTNLILKRIIDSWKLEYHNRLAEASQKVRNSGENGSRQSDETAIVMLENLLNTLEGDERLKNAKRLVSLGGLEFLTRRIEHGNIEEKICAASLLSCCIEADPCCRNRIARVIDKQCLLVLLYSKQSKSRRNAVILLTQLVCLSRRKDVSLLLSGLGSEEIMTAMHVLVLYLQSSPPEQRPMVAALLLHLDLLFLMACQVKTNMLLAYEEYPADGSALQGEPRKYSIYREEAVSAISESLEGALTDDTVREMSSRALLILGGHFSASGQPLTETWILRQAGFCKNPEANSGEDNWFLNDSVSQEDEEEACEEWLRKLSASLLGDGKKSFLEAIAKCLDSGTLDLVRVCLTTIVWLSRSLCSKSDADFQLSALSVLISGLKSSLANGKEVEQNVLASICLLNFSKIPECRNLLMTVADELAAPLRSLAEVTWTAKELYAIIFEECL